MLSGIVGRCLDPEREKRYQSAAELLADLEAFQPSSHLSAATVIARPAATPRIYKWLTVVFAILLVAGAGALAWIHYTKAIPAQHAPVSVLVSDFERIHRQFRDGVRRIW